MRTEDTRTDLWGSGHSISPEGKDTASGR